MPSTLVAVATYNERENLPVLIERIFQAIPVCHFLVVDDCSPDGTGDWVEEQMLQEPRLHCLHRAGKLGLGSAVIEAARYAIENRYDFFINLDADLSHDPGAIPSLISRMESDIDVVIGSRYVKGGKIEGWPLRRKLTSRCVNGFARLMLSLKTRDNSGSFRCYRVSMLEKLDFSGIRSQGYSFFEEILFRLRQVGAKFVEVPITFSERKFGSSKVDRREAVRSINMLFSLAAENFFPPRSRKIRPQ